MIVAPEREVPGISEKHWRLPPERLPPGDLVHRGDPWRGRALLDQDDQDAADDERDRDADRVEQGCLDPVVERQPERGGRRKATRRLVTKRCARGSDRVP